MSVVKKPALCGPFIPIEQGDISPSKSSVLKSETTMSYLEDNWNRLFQNKRSREERRNAFLQSSQAQQMTEEEREYELQQFNQEESAQLRSTRAPIKLSRFTFYKLIGSGSFSKVWLVQDSEDQQYYAMKIIRKAGIVFTEQLNEVRAERDLFTQDNPWVVQLKCSFQDSQKLYLVLEFIQGGDLLSYISDGILRKMKPLCQFYFAELVLAINSVHNSGIVHGDMKPQNVLICPDGHIKLADFGVATNFTNSPNRLSSIIEEMQNVLLETSYEPTRARRPPKRQNEMTYAYTAPEVLLQNDISPAADFWSLGVILYEMLSGYTPFMKDDVQDTIKSIINWRKTLRYPSELLCDKYAVDLMTHLLCDKEDRYEFEQIIRHPFLRNYNFQFPQSNIPPMIPSITSPTDTHHFDDNLDPNWDTQMPDIKYSETLARFAFLGYTYKKAIPRHLFQENPPGEHQRIFNVHQA